MNTVPAGPRATPPPAADTLAGLLREAVRRHHDRIAIVAPGRPPLTYAGLGRQLDATVRALAAAGFGRGSRIGLAFAGGADFAVALLAIFGAATAAPLDHRLEEATLVGLLKAMRIDGLIVADSTAPAALRAAALAGVALLRLQAAPEGAAGEHAIVAARWGDARCVEAPQADDVGLLAHTSGTTAAPKVVPLEQSRLAEGARSRARLVDLTADDRTLLLNPLHSVAGVFRGLLAPLSVGASAVCPDELPVGGLADLVEVCSPTLFSAPPVLLSALVEEFERRTPRPRLPLRLILSSQAQMRAPLQRRIEEAFGVPLVRAYGMTEAGNIAQGPLPPARAPDGSVGRPQHAEVAIADELGRPLGPGEEGEILVRGAEVFGGYENDEEANRRAFRDGWFRTGDAGRLDRDGFLYLSGRIKDLINRGGTKIAPREVEAALEAHPAVVEAAAFAVPHATLGEDVGAAVVLRDAGAADGADLRRFARSRLVAYKVPSRLLLLPSLPRGALGKVDRRALVELARQGATSDTDPPRDGDEARVAAIFAQVLGLPAVGRSGRFFELGGDSLRGVQVLALVEQTLGVRADLDLLFEHPDVAGFAAALRAQPQAAPPSDRPGADR